MIQRTFKEPNFKCKVIGEDGEEYEWLAHADSEDELRRQLEKRGYTIVSIREYDFEVWKAKAEEATREAIESIESGNKPEFKSSIWSELKLHLFEIFDGKCAYCESKVLHVASGDVEHYRPKKKVTKVPLHQGYYWMAYNTSNLLPSCEKCNRARGKKNHFPVKETRVYSHQEDLGSEEPLLLHPYDHDPAQHLYFPPSVGTVAGVTDKGEESVEIYNLKRDKLTEKRREEQENVVKDLEYYIIKDRARLRSIWHDMRCGIRQYSAAALAQASAWWEELCSDVGDDE